MKAKMSQFDKRLREIIQYKGQITVWALLNLANVWPRKSNQRRVLLI